jgi:hypothetical protein
MIRRTARKLLRRLRRSPSRDQQRGIRADVPIPFDMFEQVRDVKGVHAAAKLANIYHKGQRKIWDGKEVLAELVDKHGGIELPAQQRKAIQELFAVILWGELAAWKISADLALRLEPLEAKLAATSQTHDEARHFYTMVDYLELIGDLPTELPPRTRRVLESVLEADSLPKKLVGMQLMVEPMALTLFQLVREKRIEPVLCDLLELYERDEARHVALGVLHMPKLLAGMTTAEAMNFWTWEFREYWAQIDMLKELQPSFEALGIDVRDVVRVGRNKQIRANKMLMEELGYDIQILNLFMRFFDAKAAWHWPEHALPEHHVGRFREALEALIGDEAEVPMELTNVVA